MAKSTSLKTAVLLFFAGIITSTWDLFLTHDFAGVTFKAHQGFFLLAFLSTLYALKDEGMSALLAKGRTPFSLSMFLLAFYYAAAAPWSYFALKSFLYDGWILFNLATIWLTATLLAPYLSRRKLAWMAVIAGAIQASIITVDHIAYAYGYTGGLIGFNQDGLLHWGLNRPHGLTNEPSYAASFLCLTLLLACSLFRSHRAPWRYFPVVLLLGFALFATTSRTGWLGFFLGLAIFLAISFRRLNALAVKRLALGFSVGVAVTVALFALSIPSAQKDRLYQKLVGSLIEGTDGPSNARLRAFGHAWEMAKETHFLGTGLGASYKYWISTRHNPETALEGEFTNQSYGKEVVMSIWGQLLAEGGPLAVLLYGTAAYFLVSGLWRAWKATGDALVLGSLSAALVFFFLIAFLLGNVARGDVWIWFAIWSRMTMPDGEASKTTAV